VSAPEVRYVWRAAVARVVDGDTVDLVIDVGFRGTRAERVRLIGINCPEVHGPTAAAGRKAAEFTRQWVTEFGTPSVVVETFKSDVFGRWLARVYGPAGSCLNDELIQSGNAVPFRG
jgi:micrococcal nuclease